MVLARSDAERRGEDAQHLSLVTSSCAFAARTPWVGTSPMHGERLRAAHHEPSPMPAGSPSTRRGELFNDGELMEHMEPSILNPESMGSSPECLGVCSVWWGLLCGRLHGPWVALVRWMEPSI